MDKLKAVFKKNRNAIIILVLIIVAFWVYQRSGQEIEPLISILDKDSAQGLLGQELVVELERIKALNNINVNFFDNPDFKSLEDISVEVSTQPLGRDNPFIPS